MTATALRGRHSTDPRVSDRANKTTGASGEFCPHPDVLAVVRQIGYMQPSQIRQLQRVYNRVIANADADFDFGGYVLTMLRRSGSVPVDRIVGERVANQLTALR